MRFEVDILDLFSEILSMLNLPAVHRYKYHANILRKTIEGYSDSVSSLTFNTMETLLIIHTFHSSRYLQSKCMLYFSYASMV